MKNQLRIIWRGQETWRFHPHRIDEAACEIVTPRHLGPPPAPVGSIIVRGDETLGTLRCTHREKFNRYRMVYDPPAREISQENIAAEPETASEPKPEPSGTPIAALGEHLDNQRILGTLVQIAHSVEELAARDDELLLAIDGIGPARLADIRQAIARALPDEAA